MWALDILIPPIGLLGQLPPGRKCAADTAYDSDDLRQYMRERGTLPVIPNNRTRKRLHAFDRKAYKRHNHHLVDLIEPRA